MRHILVTTLILTASPALAEAIPGADIDQYCRRTDARTERFGTHQAQYDQCMQRAQGFYDELKPVWSQINDEEQKACIAKVIGWDSFIYMHLRDCAQFTILKNRRKEREEADAQARREIPKQQFRY